MSLANDERTDLLGVRELAAYLGVPKSWIYERTRSGHPDPLPCFRVGNYLRFRIEEIDTWVEAHRKRGARAGAS